MKKTLFYIAMLLTGVVLAQSDLGSNFPNINPLKIEKMQLDGFVTAEADLCEICAFVACTGCAYYNDVEKKEQRQLDVGDMDRRRTPYLS